MPMVKGGITRDAFTQKVAATGYSLNVGAGWTGGTKNKTVNQSFHFGLAGSKWMRVLVVVHGVELVLRFCFDKVFVDAEEFHVDVLSSSIYMTKGVGDVLARRGGLDGNWFGEEIERRAKEW